MNESDTNRNENTERENEMNATAKTKSAKTVCATRRTGVNFGHVGEVRYLTQRGPGRVIAETVGTYPTAAAAMEAARKMEAGVARQLENR